jgi:anti-anti-sigma factor
MPTIADAYGSMTVLSVSPTLTAQEDEQFRLTVAEQIRSGGRWFVLNLEGVGLFDSQGLESLLWFQEQVEAVSGIVKVAGLRGNARKAFEIVRFDKKFEVCETVHDAVKSFH